MADETKLAAAGCASFMHCGHSACERPWR